ncbi:hypothetical protein C1H46_023409 [Malus baccata]|uniref:Uncharacterized protein n=1 Tax=Malus baccata TaxID=106549 RepID=A0A540LXM7_MALBA|nr:hypothetical protein C1H46_023409 [Malus baccata]
MAIRFPLIPLPSAHGVLKSKRGDESKEVAKDPYKLKRPASALFVVMYVSFFQ